MQMPEAIEGEEFQIDLNEQVEELSMGYKVVEVGRRRLNAELTRLIENLNEAAAGRGQSDVALERKRPAEGAIPEAIAETSSLHEETEESSSD